MIVCISQSNEIVEELRVATSLKIVQMDPNDILEIYSKKKVKALIVEVEKPGNPFLIDVVNTMARRIPVIVTFRFDPQNIEIASNVTLINDLSVPLVIATLKACGVVDSSSKIVPIFNPHMATNRLKQEGSLGILTIDASAFRKVEVEYGRSIYLELKRVFQQVLVENWGVSEWFRGSDLLCKRSDHHNSFYIFLSPSRQAGGLPLPGVLEGIADRIGQTLRNMMWAEVNKRGEEKRLPSSIRAVPDVIVGYASCIDNPCFDPSEIIANAVELSNQSIITQKHRVKTRYRELLQTLICVDNILRPHFQGVFHLQSMTIEEARDGNGKLESNVKHLFGFESLIRIQRDVIKATLPEDLLSVDARYLTPDVLFYLANLSKVALELDQVCMEKALKEARDLPGYLMVNVLPRNMQFIDKLLPILKRREYVIAEVSESENLNNHDLVKNLGSLMGDIRIAADDFGRGYAGLERLLEMKPSLIKFDRSLISGIDSNKIKQHYVHGLIEASRMMNTELLAEGVETIEEFALLKDLGIEYIQGYLLHRPESVEDVQIALAASETKRVKSLAS
jgi:EAL domain-containing protein (putative c-di-GMP-specific phosphodiesterase class I)